MTQFPWFQIEKLHVSHDNSGRDPDWYLEEVTIDVPDKGEQYIFPCHRWLVGSQRDVALTPGTFFIHYQGVGDCSSNVITYTHLRDMHLFLPYLYKILCQHL